MSQTTVPPEEQAKTERLSIRATAYEKALIDEAAGAARTSRSQFVIDSATERAEEILRQTALTAEAYDRFVEALEEPPVEKPRLRELFEGPSQIPAG